MPEKPFHITPREWAILELYNRGLACKEIADRLGVSRNTIKAHLSNIRCKTAALSSIEAIYKALAQYGTLPKWPSPGDAGGGGSLPKGSKDR